MADMLSVRKAVERLEQDGIPVSEYTLRIWIKQGKLKVVYAGSKALVYYPALVAYVTGTKPVD